MTVDFVEHWYSFSEFTNLRQGDILPDLAFYVIPQDVPVIEGDPGKVSLDAEGDRATWIVTSASCDVDRGENDPPPGEERPYPYVLLGRVVEAKPESFGLAPGDAKTSRSILELARRGRDPSKFFLPAYEPAGFPMSVVSWKTHITMPISYLVRASIGKRRLRLKHPFRESFGQWAGACISRVGPENETLHPPISGMNPVQHLKAVEAEAKD